MPKDTSCCPKCRATGIIIKGYDNLKGRPEFKCTCCDETWTYGNDGGQYVEVANRYMEKNGIVFPKKPNMDSEGFNLDFVKKWA